MNLVLADAEEFRRIKRRQNKPAAPGSSAPAVQTVEQEEKRTLGLTIIRGAHIVSLSVESPPPADPSARLGKSTGGGLASTLQAGPGVARPAGRGAAAPISLAGPAAGVGGAAPPPPFPGFPGAAPPGFPGRGGRKLSFVDLISVSFANTYFSSSSRLPCIPSCSWLPRCLWFPSLVPAPRRWWPRWLQPASPQIRRLTARFYR